MKDKKELKANIHVGSLYKLVERKINRRKYFFLFESLIDFHHPFPSGVPEAGDSAWNEIEDMPESSLLYSVYDVSLYQPNYDKLNLEDIAKEL